MGTPIMTNEELVFEIQSGRNVRENLGLLYEQNRPLIVKTVYPYSAYCELDDLMQEAFFGLQKAAERFDPEAGAAFITYALYWVRQSAQRYVENNGTSKRLPVGIQQRIRKIDRFRDEYRLTHGGQEPAAEEIISALEITLEQYERACKAESASHMKSLDSPVGEMDGGGSFGDFIPDARDLIGDVLDASAHEAAAGVLWQAVDMLPGKRRDVIRARYQEGLTFKQIADELGVSGAYTQQLEESALKALAKMEQVQNLKAVYDLYPGAYGGGVESFKRTNTSSTERAAIKRVNIWERLERSKAEYAEAFGMTWEEMQQMVKEYRQQQQNGTESAAERLI